MCENLENTLETIERRSYKTYVSRLNAYQRLKHRANAWDFTLVLCSTVLLLLSIYILLAPKADTSTNNFFLVSMTLISLVVSLVVAGVNYHGRAYEMYRNYRALQRLSTEIETVVKMTADPSLEETLDYNRRYQDLLDFTENHSHNDYFMAFPPTGDCTKKESETANGNKKQSKLAKILVQLSKIRSRLKIFVFDWFAPGVFWCASLLIAVHIIK